MEVDDPDNTAMSARHEQRVAAENERFSVEHYAADYDGDDDGVLREIQSFQPEWQVCLHCDPWLWAPGTISHPWLTLQKSDLAVCVHSTGLLSLRGSSRIMIGLQNTNEILQHSVVCGKRHDIVSFLHVY